MGDANADAELEPGEEKQVQERSRLRPVVVHKTVLEEGEDELERPASSLWWSGLAAGTSMGFSLVGEALLRAHLPDAPWRPLVAKLGYTLGFLFVVLARQQLFTENTLTAVIPVFERRSHARVRDAARVWGIVFAANMAGALVFAALIAFTRILDPASNAAALDITREALGHDPLTIGLTGVMAGWLIALMVWMLPSASRSILGLVIIVAYVIGLAGLAHVIAGGVEAFYAAFRGLVSWQDATLGFILPALIGNCLGGVLMVASLNHAQVAAEKKA